MIIRRYNNGLVQLEIKDPEDIFIGPKLFNHRVKEGDQINLDKTDREELTPKIDFILNNDDEFFEKAYQSQLSSAKVRENLEKVFEYVELY